MKRVLSLTILLIGLSSLTLHNPPPEDFKKEQLRYSRVRGAYEEKEAKLKQELAALKINGTFELFIRAFKKERVLEVWAKPKGSSAYKHLKDYRFCTTSGRLGPKRKQGDRQIPEGFYHIDRFNPYSNFHLSLGINYPNQSDRKLGYRTSLGGDIFIHGSCVTIGCIPITDEGIKELYLLAVEARHHGQLKIPVHIFPAKLSDRNFQTLIEIQKPDPTLLAFWRNLRPGYKHFEQYKRLPKIGVNIEGRYTLMD